MFLLHSLLLPPHIQKHDANMVIADTAHLLTVATVSVSSVSSLGCANSTPSATLVCTLVTWAAALLSSVNAVALKRKTNSWTLRSKKKQSENFPILVLKTFFLLFRPCFLYFVIIRPFFCFSDCIPFFLLLACFGGETQKGTVDTENWTATASFPQSKTNIQKCPPPKSNLAIPTTLARIFPGLSKI